MTPFTLIAAKAGVETTDRIDRFTAAAAARGWRAIPLSRSVVLAVGPGAALDFQTMGAWRLVGDVFPRRDGMAGAPECAADLIGQVWGRYVALRLRDDGRLAAVLRDPSGALDALLLQTADHWIVASDLPDWLLGAVRPALQIDDARVAGVLQDPTRTWDVSLLNGVDSVTPGGCLLLEDRPVAQQVWRPSAFVDTAADLTLDAAGDGLREVVDESVSQLSKRAGVLAAELSGGLDSGIVATSLARLDPPVRAWLHSYGAAPESDERAFALPLAERLGVTPDLLKRPDAALSQEDLEGLSSAFRPGFNAMDPVNDGIAAERLEALGIETVLTGKGGDAVFFQAFGEEVFADLRQRRGLRALVSSTLPAVARWEGRSIFSVVAGRRARPSDPQAGFLAPDAPTLAPHPWLEAAPTIGPAKRLQIVGMLDGAGFSAASPANPGRGHPPSPVEPARHGGLPGPPGRRTDLGPRPRSRPPGLRRAPDAPDRYAAIQGRPHRLLRPADRPQSRRPAALAAGRRTGRARSDRPAPRRPGPVGRAADLARRLSRHHGGGDDGKLASDLAIPAGDPGSVVSLTRARSSQAAISR